MSQHHVPALEGRTIRCILFDLGSTLWIYEENASLSAQRQASQQQVLAILRRHVNADDFPHVDDSALGKQITQTVDQHIYERYLQTENIEPDFARDVIEALQQLGFPPVDRTVGAEIFEALRVRSFGSRTLFKDALSTLAELKRRGFLLGVVTNRSYGGPLFIEDMKNFGLLDYFEERTIAISADLNVRKPHPAIFQHSLDALNVPAQEAVMVGDSLSADVVGAKQLDMIAVWKPHPNVYIQARAEQQHIEHDTQTFSQRLFEASRQYQKSRRRPISELVMPDLIIEHLSELLDVFGEVGQY